MQLDRYELKGDVSKGMFEFTSEGLRGNILKVIQFKPINFNNLYNLSFCDKNLQTGKLDDRVVTDNGDSKKVLATVVASVYMFTNKYPDAWIYAKGSTEGRNRLYRIGISSVLHEIERDFEVFGELKNKWIPFTSNTAYDAFVVKRKSINFTI